MEERGGWKVTPRPCLGHHQNEAEPSSVRANLLDGM